MKKGWYLTLLLGAVFLVLIFGGEFGVMKAQASPLLAASGNSSGNNEPTSIYMDKTSATVEKGKTVQLNATVYPTYAYDRSVSWSTSDSKIATVSRGLVTAKAAGTAVITARTVNGLSTSCSVKVIVKPNGIGISLDTLNMNRGEVRKLGYVLSPSDVTEKTVRWSSGNTGVATVDSNGQVTAKGAGQTKITVTTSNGLSSSCIVTVTVKPEGIGVLPDSLTLKKGQQFKMSATVVPTDATDKTVTWSSGNTSVAVVDSNGLVTAVAPGNTTITATTVNQLKSVCKLKIIVEPSSISLDSSSLVLTVGENGTLTATLSPQDVTEKTITWSTANQKVAAVTTSGVVIANAPGKTTITAKTSNGKTATCEVVCLYENVPENPFADLKSAGSPWQYTAAKYVYDNGYMSGKEELIPGKKMFAPSSLITRAEFVQILYNVEGKPSVEYSSKFNDVPQGAWFTQAILWATDNNIASGKGDNFDVKGSAKREQLAIFFYNYAKYLGYDVTPAEGQGKRVSDFPDGGDASSYAVSALDWALSYSIMNGRGTGELDPRGTATRVESATMLRNFINALGSMPTVKELILEKGLNPELDSELNPELDPELNPELKPESDEELNPETDSELNPETDSELNPELDDETVSDDEIIDGKETAVSEETSDTVDEDAVVAPEDSENESVSENDGEEVVPEEENETVVTEEEEENETVVTEDDSEVPVDETIIE